MEKRKKPETLEELNGERGGIRNRASIPGRSGEDPACGERMAAAGYFRILNYYESLHLCG